MHFEPTTRSRPERQARDRGVTRSKAEKVRPPTVPVPQVDIVPGRLTEAEWLALAAVEEGEDVVGDILADLLARVMDSAFRVYLTQQCIPFTISQAREAMLQITEWRFLARDEGESSLAEDPTWGEEEEPLACTTDAWAQGSVPVLHTPTAGGPEETFPNEDPGGSGRSGLEGSSPGGRLSTEPGLSPGPAPNPGWLEETRPRGPLEGPFEDAELGESVEGQLEKTGPGGLSEAPEDQETLPLVGSSSESCHGSVEALPPSSPGAPSLEVLQEASVEIGQPSAPTGWELDFCLPQSEGTEATAQPRVEVPQDAPSSLVAFHSVDTPPSPGPSVLLQPWGQQLRPAEGQVTLFRQQASSVVGTQCLDPPRRPCRWVRPLVKVLVPGSMGHPLDTYRKPRRPPARAVQPSHVAARAQGPRVMPAAPVHPQPGLPSHTGGPSPRPWAPSLCCPSPPFGSKLPFLSSGLRFLSSSPELPALARRPSPKLWPSVQWPSNWEVEAELWRSCARAPPRGLDPTDRGDPECPRWPHTTPTVLESTSQVRCKPLLLPETVKLAPGVSLWDVDSQVLVSSAEAPGSAHDAHTPPVPQWSIHVGAHKPLVTVAQSASPKVRWLPSPHLPCGGPTWDVPERRLGTAFRKSPQCHFTKDLG
ncbi:PREDICTED: uncharacterized protein C2orf81 homolog [Elephantulus edwardii]|uniref:uncharacterized protein C2orf81 homolog n=1 Tax=Elephantulus edwardii TaxID=28737 RepID=UPI0003F05A42|nr:PREDICTED: uncharacterized protein C2orf81 homolog [Elephantulus edwardii]